MTQLNDPPLQTLRDSALPLQLPAGPAGTISGRHPSHLIQSDLYSDLVQGGFAAAACSRIAIATAVRPAPWLRVLVND